MSAAATEPLAIPLPDQIDLPGLAAALDASTHEGRLAWVWSLKSRQIGELFRATRADTVGLDDLLVGDGPTACEGRNGLPLFNRFAKVFARVDGKVVGYNRQWWLQSLVVGHGHFELVPAPDGPGVIVEYRKPVEKTHPSFPRLHSNNGPISYLVYGCMYDAVHRVSEHVFVGDSIRSLPGGAPFIVVRPPT